MKYVTKVLLIIAVMLVSSTFSASILKSMDIPNSNAYSTSAEALAAAPTVNQLTSGAYKTPEYVESIVDVRGNHYTDKNKIVQGEADAGNPDSGLPKNVTPGVLPSKIVRSK